MQLRVTQIYYIYYNARYTRIYTIMHTYIYTYIHVCHTATHFHNGIVYFGQHQNKYGFTIDKFV